MGNAALLQILRYSFSLTFYREMTVMTIYCLDDTHEASAEEGPMLLLVAAPRKTVQELDPIDLQLRDH